jgi:hypothetical protein
MLGDRPRTHPYNTREGRLREYQKQRQDEVRLLKIAGGGTGHDWLELSSVDQSQVCWHLSQYYEVDASIIESKLRRFYNTAMLDGEVSLLNLKLGTAARLALDE